MRDATSLWRAWAALAVVLVLTAGCADAASSAGRSRPAAAASRPASPATSDRHGTGPAVSHAGAAVLGTRIDGCHPKLLAAPAAARQLRLGDPSDVASAAACTLRGRTAIILTYSDDADQTAVEAQLRDRVAFYATGTGWSAAPTDTSEPAGQSSIVQDVALALDGTIQAGGG